MNQPPPIEKQTGKRIVSKAEYVQIWGVQWGLEGLIYCLSGVTAVSAGIALLSLLGIVLCLCMGSAGLALPCLAFCSFFALLSFITFNLWKTAKESLIKFANLKGVVPLTRANTADLPAPESLVRASAEPIQEQQAVLLRAATEGQQTPPEQLVRAAEATPVENPAVTNSPM